MGKGSPSPGSVFDFKPGTLQVDRPNDGVLGHPLSTAPANVSPFVSVGAAPVQAPQPSDFVSVGAMPMQAPQPIQAPEPAQTNITVNTPMETAPATLDLSDDGGIDIEPATPFVPRPEPDPRSFVGQPAAPSPTPFLQEIGAATPDAPAQSSGFGKGGTRGGSSLGRFGSRGFSKGARGYSQGGSLSAQPSIIAPIISVPIPVASLGDRVVPPPSEPQQIADYDYTLNTLKPRPIYPGASFANVGLEGYNTLENIQENQGLSPFDQSQRSMITGTSTGQLSQATANPGNQQGGLASLKNTIGAMS